MECLTAHLIQEKYYQINNILNNLENNKEILLSHHYQHNTYILSILFVDVWILFQGKCKSYLKLTQHHFGRKVKEIYSPYVSATQQFCYQFTVDLKVDSSALQNSFIVISVKMRTFLKKDMLVGRVILGPFFYAEYGKSLTPWGRALINRETVSHIFRMYLWFIFNLYILPLTYTHIYSTFKSELLSNFYQYIL